jgi:putative endonuclease
MKKFSSESQKIGELGEYIACNYLKARNYLIIERNYTKKWGEIDIVAQKGEVTHFIEVKSVSRSSFDEIMGDFRPEDQMHPWKQMRLMRTIETYLGSHRIDDWQFDLVCVFIDSAGKRAKVRLVDNIILC